MAPDKLALCTLSGPLDGFDQAIQTFVVNRQFHPVDTISHMKGLKSLVPFESGNPYEYLLKDIDRLASDLEIDLSYKTFDTESLNLPEIISYFNQLTHTLDILSEERKSLTLTIADNNNIIGTLKHLGNISEGMETLFSMKSAKFRFGRMPTPIYHESIQWINGRQDAYYITTSIEENYAYGMYFALPSSEDRVDSFFIALRFERIWIPEKVRGTPEESIARLTADVEAYSSRIDGIEEEMLAIANTHRSRFLRYYSYIRFISESHSLREYAGRSSESFYLVGWIPLNISEEYSQAVESHEGYSCVLTDADDIPDTSPPIRRRPRLLSKLYTPYLEMYGLPDYREFDPGLLMAITYSLFFGIMFGDMGQGIILFLFGLIIYKVKGMWLGGVLTCCGVSATIFGFTYGSVFGNEELLGGFKVLEDGNAVNILLISAGIGVVMITICMMINIINGIKQKDLDKIIFSANGICGLVFYLAIIIGLVCTIAFGNNLFSTPYVIILIILPLILMWVKQPIIKLIEKDPDWKPESVSGLIIEGFFELFETILSYVSNTISFLRIGAFAISHSGMMMVVYMLAGGDNLIVLIVGNLFVMALEALLVCIQLLRLEFYEIFGRFYSDGGEKFSPHIIDYTKIYSE